MAATNFYGTAYVVPSFSSDTASLTGKIQDRLEPSLTGDALTPNPFRNNVIGKRIPADATFAAQMGGTNTEGNASVQFVWRELTGAVQFDVYMSLNGIDYVRLPASGNCTWIGNQLTYPGSGDINANTITISTALATAAGPTLTTVGAAGSSILMITGIVVPVLRVVSNGGASAGYVEIYRY